MLSKHFIDIITMSTADMQDQYCSYFAGDEVVGCKREVLAQDHYMNQLLTMQSYTHFLGRELLIEFNETCFQVSNTAPAPADVKLRPRARGPRVLQ